MEMRGGDITAFLGQNICKINDFWILEFMGLVRDAREGKYSERLNENKTVFSAEPAGKLLFCS